MRYTFPGIDAKKEIPVERAGRAPKYSETTAKIVATKKPEDLDPKSVWDEFCVEFEGKGTNPRDNSLAPKGTEFTHKGATHLTVGISVIELDRTLEMSLVQ